MADFKIFGRIVDVFNPRTGTTTTKKQTIIRVGNINIMDDRIRDEAA